MNPWAIPLIVLLVLAAAWVVYTFNQFVRLRNRLAEAWSAIDVQLKRRHELVPVLVECVRGYQAHEHEVLEETARARAEAVGARTIPEAARTQARLAWELRTLFGVAEAYPSLKADSQYRQLADTLVSIEDTLQFARRYYNGVARDYNILAESFPERLLARLFGLPPAEYYEVEYAAIRDTPVARV